MEKQLSENVNQNIIDLSELKPGQGFAIEGIEKAKRLPQEAGSVSGAGDINNDGFNDIILSNPSASIEDLPNVGRVYLIFGGKNLGSSGNFDLNNLDGSNGFVINGVEEISNFGESISRAGDVNNDGIDDIIIGAPQADIDENIFAGKGYVIFGNSKIGDSGNLELSELDGSNGFEIRNTEKYRLTGSSVSYAGDINNDGIDDFAIGTSFSSEITKDYVVFGNRELGSSGSIELSNIDGSNGFAIATNQKGRNFNHYLNYAGDINGDSIDDLAIGIPNAGNSTLIFNFDSIAGGKPASGRSYVIYGDEKLGNSGEVNLSSLDRDRGFTVKIDYPGSFFGRSVSNAGDINNDGINDVILGGTLGGGHVIFGEQDLTISGEFNVANLNGKNGFSITDAKSVFLGSSVRSAGDFNHDGIDDIAIVSTIEENNHRNANKGEGYIIFGKQNILNGRPLKLSQLKYGEGLILKNYGSYRNDYEGSFYEDRSKNNAIDSLGDINGDGISDLIIGVPGMSDLADSYVIFGSSDYQTKSSQVDIPNLAIGKVFQMNGLADCFIFSTLFLYQVWVIEVLLRRFLFYLF